MIKRIVWWTAGALMGAGGSTYLQMKFRKSVQAKIARYSPPKVLSATADKARDARSRVTGAVREGRAAMAERETELRARITNRSGAPKLRK